jgi:fatty-acyl-CoA synthase
MLSKKRHLPGEVCTMGWLADETGLERRPANHRPLTPLTHLARAAEVWPRRTAVVWRGLRFSYAEYHARVSRLASALAGIGVRPGDVAATLLPNVPPQAEAHFGVPACGAVLNTINTRLDPDTVGYILATGRPGSCSATPRSCPLPKPPWRGCRGRRRC